MLGLGRHTSVARRTMLSIIRTRRLWPKRRLSALMDLKFEETTGTCGTVEGRMCWKN